MLRELAPLARAIEDDIVERHAISDTLDARGRLSVRRPWAWRLAGLARGISEGGRIVVDVLSRDHLLAVLGTESRRTSPHRRERLRSWRGLVAPAQLARAADLAGLRIVAAVPYGVLLGGPGPGLSHLGPLEQTCGWRRTLSWLPQDPRLTELVLLLERAVVANLPMLATHRTLVVLEKARGQENSTWLRRQQDAAGAWRRGELLRAGPVDPALVSELGRCLHPTRARFLGFLLVDALQQLLEVDEATLWGAERTEEYRAWRRARAIDAATTHFLREWPRGVDARLRRRVDTTLAVDYGLARDLLEEHFRLFSGQV